MRRRIFQRGSRNSNKEGKNSSRLQEKTGYIICHYGWTGEKRGHENYLSCITTGWVRVSL